MDYSIKRPFNKIVDAELQRIWDKIKEMDEVNSKNDEPETSPEINMDALINTLSELIKTNQKESNTISIINNSESINNIRIEFGKITGEVVLFDKPYDKLLILFPDTIKLQFANGFIVPDNNTFDNWIAIGVETNGLQPSES